ncbi:structure-specific endonuclease subunit slx4 [Aspergillus recurvatus]
MQVATDFVVLSSSPDASAIYAPPLPGGDSKRTSLRGPSLSPSPSPFASPPAPVRSRFFSTPPYSLSKTIDRITEDVNKEKRTTTEGNSAFLEDKSKRGGRKPKSTSQTEVQDLGQDNLQNREDAPTKPKKARKKQGSGAGGKNLKNKTIFGKVTKSGVSKARTSVVKLVDGEKNTCEHNAGKADTHGCEEDDLQLELAMTRRRDWTPKKQTAIPVIDLDDQDGAANREDGFGTLLSGYEYAGMTTALNRHKVLTGNGPTKRRRIELVDSRVLPTKPKSLFEDDTVQISESNVPISAALEPSKKPKPKPKRLTTLTARVTASYEASANCSDSVDQESLITTESSMGAKSKSRRTKRKAVANPDFKVPRIIYSPEEAVKSLDQQDLVFGTCSQLQREDSPTMLRDTQVALQESEKELTTSLGQSSQTARYSSAISRLATRRNLWSVAARDTEGQLADIEVLDLVDSPGAAKSIASFLNDDKGKDKDRSPATESSISSDAAPAKPLASTYAPTNKELPASTSHTFEQSVGEKPKARPMHSMPYYRGKTDLQLASEVQSYGLKLPKNREKMIELLEKCWVAKYGPIRQGVSEEPQPKVRVETTPPASGQKKVEQNSKYKQTKTATQMRTTRLRSQLQRNASEPTRESCETITTTAAVKENKQHRPGLKLKEQQLNSKRSFIDVEEIQDSEDEFLPSLYAISNQLLVNTPQKEGKNNINKKQKRQELPTSTIPSSPSSRIPLAPASFTTRSQQTKTKTSLPISVNRELHDLGQQITKAVRAQPRRSQSQSPAAIGTRKRPSWHEKILMYEPIYLEDFTAWLNTEGLALVDEDREVTIGFVRQWCESKGICCCFRVKKTAEHY